MSDNPINTDRIDEFIQQHGPANCYMGITANIRNRFVAHRLIDSEGNSLDTRIGWYWGNARTEENARTIENNYQSRFQELQGNIGGGTNPTNVYVYRIVSGVTNEDA